MKNFIKLSVILLLFVTVISSCKKDDDPDPTIEYNLDTDYFTVNNASYVESEFPDASSGTLPVINTINGNPTIIPGGSNPIVLQSDDDISNILIGVQGVGGYYKLPSSNAKTTGDYLFYILMNQTLVVTTFNIVIAIQTASGTISSHSIIAVSLVQVGTGKLQVSCSWNQPNDVDLHLVEPNGEEIYYGDGVSNNGGELDLDSNAGCSIDGVNNENITYSDDATVTVEAGEYIVRVDFWANCEVTDNTNYNVIAYYDGALISASYGTNPYSGTFAPDEENSGGLGDGVTVMKFNIPSGKSSTDGNTEVYKMTFPSDKKEVKNLSPQKSQ